MAHTGEIQIPTTQNQSIAVGFIDGVKTGIKLMLAVKACFNILNIPYCTPSYGLLNAKPIRTCASEQMVLIQTFLFGVAVHTLYHFCCSLSGRYIIIINKRYKIRP